MWPNRSTTGGKRKYVQKQPKKTERNDYNSTYDYDWQRNQGLPNMGNTCFLSSAIQFLYSSTLFRQAMFQLNGLKQSFESYIQKIFLSIQYECSFYEKRQILDEIIKFLKKKNLDFDKYEQQDCFQFIMFILDNIGENHPDILSLFKLYYKFVCENCHNVIKRKDYIIFNEYVICEKCKLSSMEIKFISVPKCMILTGTSSNQKNLKVRTVEEKQIPYQLMSKVIYSGNGRYGHYVVSRRKNNDKKDDKFYTFSDSNMFQDRSSYYPYYDIYEEKALLCLYEIDDKPQVTEVEPVILKPFSLAKINIQLSKIYADPNLKKEKYEYHQISVQKQKQSIPKQKPSIQKENLPPKDMQNVCDLIFLFKILGVEPLKELIRSYANIKSLTLQIEERHCKQSKIVQEVRSILFNSSSNRYYSLSRVEDETGYLREYLQNEYNDRTKILVQGIYEKLSRSKCIRERGQLLKFVMFISFSILLASELPKLQDSFTFIFKYDCFQCGKVTQKEKGYFITNDTYFCCQKPIDFKRFYFEQKPKYLIYIKNSPVKQGQPFYCLNRVNMGYPLQYCQKSYLKIGPQLNFLICQENIFKVRISLPKSHSSTEYICNNQTIKQLTKKLNIDIQTSLLMTKNKVKINQQEQYVDLKSLLNLQLEKIKFKSENRNRILSTDYLNLNINVILMN